MNIAVVALCRVAGTTAPFLRWSPTRSTAGAAAAIPMATGTNRANVRVRWGSSANTSTSITGVAYSEPRLWLSSATSASSTAPPARAPRTPQGSERLRAIRSAGQNAINHWAAFAFG